MKQVFAYEPPSARRGLMKNSDSNDELDEDEIEELEEKSLKSLIRLLVFESLVGLLD